jgi:hypothetical protein
VIIEIIQEQEKLKVKKIRILAVLLRSCRELSPSQLEVVLAQILPVIRLQAQTQDQVKYLEVLEEIIICPIRTSELNQIAESDQKIIWLIWFVLIGEAVKAQEMPILTDKSLFLRAASASRNQKLANYAIWLEISFSKKAISRT